MAFTCTVHRERRLGVARVSGSVNVDELLQIIRTLLDDPAWEPGFDVLWDGSRVTELVVSPGEMETVAAESRSRIDRLGPGKTAIVIARDKDAELAHMFTAFAKEPMRDRRVFRSLPEALNWLDTTVPEL